MRYFYLISSLPELKLSNNSLTQLQLEELMETIMRNATAMDNQVLKCLLYPNDNQNLLFILFREYHDFEIGAFSKPSVLSAELLKNYRMEQGSLPDYMIYYLNDLSGSYASLSLRRMETELNRYFFEHVAQKESIFLNTYFTWQFELKKTIADINHKAFDYLPISSNSSQGDFGVTKALHGVATKEEVTNEITPLVGVNDLEGIETKINQYYWEFADSWPEPFSSEQLFAYMVKLQRLYQWIGFSTKGEAAKSKFEELVQGLKETEISPKMPVI
jgi:hypothetical protein